MTTGETIPRMKLGGKKMSVVISTMRKISSAARSNGRTPPRRFDGSTRSPVGIVVAILISGRMARLASPPATSKMPNVLRYGQQEGADD